MTVDLLVTSMISDPPATATLAKQILVKCCSILRHCMFRFLPQCSAHCKKNLAYFNHFCRLFQLHQSGIIIRSPRDASKIGFLKFHTRASVIKSFFGFLILSEVLFGYINGISTIAM